METANHPVQPGQLKPPKAKGTRKRQGAITPSFCLLFKQARESGKRFLCLFVTDISGQERGAQGPGSPNKKNVAWSRFLWFLLTQGTSPIPKPLTEGLLIQCPELTDSPLQNQSGGNKNEKREPSQTKPIKPFLDSLEIFLCPAR